MLYGIKAFTEHASSFVDVDDLGQPLELKGIVWLDRTEQRLARIFGGDISDISARVNPGSAGKRLISKSLCQALLPPKMALQAFKGLKS